MVRKRVSDVKYGKGMRRVRVQNIRVFEQMERRMRAVSHPKGFLNKPFSTKGKKS